MRTVHSSITHVVAQVIESSSKCTYPSKHHIFTVHFQQVLMSLIQGVRCRPVTRFVDCLSLNSGKTEKYKDNAQSLRLFGLHDDVNDAHRAGANRLQTNKQTKRERESKGPNDFCKQIHLSHAIFEHVQSFHRSLCAAHMPSSRDTRSSRHWLIVCPPCLMP